MSLKSIQRDPSLFDYEKVLRICQENRTPEEVAHQNKAIQIITDANCRNFGIVEDDTIKVPPVKRELRLYKNNQTGWFCYYTDNLQEVKGRKQADFEMPEITIVTSHGGAFDTSEFYKFESAFGERTCRWINFSLPGFDGVDERRGNYSGSVNDVSDLLEELLNHLNIKEFVFLGHSFGGFVRNYYSLKYPQRILAFGGSAVHTNSWNIGLSVWYETFIRPMGISKMQAQDLEKLLTNDESRNQITDNISKAFDQMKEFSGMQMTISPLKAIAVLRYIKMNKEKIITLPETFKKINPNIPQFIAYGKDDQFISQDKVAQTVYYLQNQSGRNSQKLIKTPEIEEILKDINFDYSKNVFYDNFLFAFQKCGHTPHLKRARELGFTFKIFVKLIDHLRLKQLLPHMIKK